MCSNSRARRLEPLSPPSRGARGRDKGVNMFGFRATTRNFTRALLELDAAVALMMAVERAMAEDASEGDLEDFLRNPVIA